MPFCKFCSAIGAVGHGGVAGLVHDAAWGSLGLATPQPTGHSCRTAGK